MMDPHKRPAYPWASLPATPSLPKASASGYVTVGGIAIWYAEFGKGPPVILLHGGLANSDHWGLLVPALQNDYRVIVMDSRGHGRSTRNEDAFCYDRMMSDVLGVMDHLELDSAAIIGTSDGSII